ncbi:Cell division control protein 6 like protein [Termitomyces sp. T112]|nr:Cell division control protein 6 like protein [Termitomyces sp. T112]
MYNFTLSYPGLSQVDYIVHIVLHPELIEVHDILAMQTTRVTRSSVLGKRSHPQEPSLPAVCEQQLQTPESTPNPKRVRTASITVDGDANKENVPPSSELDNIEVLTSRTTRSRRRMITELVTPVRSRPTLKRHASISPATPANEISKLAIATPPPTPPSLLLPLHSRARALLRSTCDSSTAQIAGRDSERATILNFLTSFLCDPDKASDATCLYISGSPGTGKTALVNSVLQDINPDAKVVFINCMALESVEILWERLIEELDVGRKPKSAGRSKKAKGRDAVEVLLSRHNHKCILVLDELDHITPTTQSLASLFSLPGSTPSTVRLIGIANTHTLTSSSSSTSSVTAASNVCTLHFAPYTPNQLQQILQTRLQPLYVDADDEGKSAAAAKKFLPAPTLMLLTKKIAAMTGDVRSVFEVLRGAIDLAVTAAAPSSPTQEDNPLNTQVPTVMPPHILAALKAYSPSSTSAPSTKATASVTATTTMTTNSEIVAKVNGLGLQARLVLLSILLASKRLDSNLPIINTVTTSTPKKTPTSPMKRSTVLPNPTTNVNGVGLEATQLYTYYSALLERSDSGIFEPVSRSEFTDLLGVLEGIGLVSGASSATAGAGGKRTFGRSSSFVGGSRLGGASRGGGDVKLANGIRSDEVLRGLGIMAAELDVMEEEVKAIWERENSRLTRDLKAIEREKERTAIIANGFEGSQED